MIRNIAKLLSLIFLATTLLAAGTALADSVKDADRIPKDTELTVMHWKQARAYEAAMRLELARQEYLLALANARAPETVSRIQTELQSIDMQIRTLR